MSIQDQVVEQVRYLRRLLNEAPRNGDSDSVYSLSLSVASS